MRVAVYAQKPVYRLSIFRPVLLFQHLRQTSIPKLCPVEPPHIEHFIILLRMYGYKKVLV